MPSSQPEVSVHPIMAVIDILLVATGIFFLAAALTHGRQFPRRARETDRARSRGAEGPATLLPRTIQRTALD